MGSKRRMPIIIPLIDDKQAVSVDDLDDHLLLLEAARHELDVEWTEALGEFEARRGHDVFGYPSVIAYLRHRVRLGGARAYRCVSMARAARRFRSTLGSWRHRQITTDQVEALFRAARRLPDEFPAAENLLIEIAGESAEETQRVLDYWVQRVERCAEADVEIQMQRRGLDYSRRPGGMIEGEFALTPAAGEAFLAAIDAASSPPGSDDDRSPRQRRHDALEDVARGFLEGGVHAEAGGERPHINVMVDVGALKGVPGGFHETEAGSVLDIATVRRLSCDSSVSRIVWSGESEILDVGRRTRVVPAGLRRAVIARDRHCTWKGCTRPPRWCDVHHVVAWADGGETALGNIRLLCRYHHTLAHRGEGGRPGSLRERAATLAGRPT